MAGPFDSTAISRRAFLGGAGLVLLGATGARYPGPNDLQPARAAVPLRKCVSMGPLNIAEGDDQDLRAHGNLDLLTSTGTRWVKLWVRWDQVQPLPASSVPFDRLGDPVANPGYPFLAALDAQIELARAQSPPIGVVLTPWLFPKWANGTSDLVDAIPGDRAFFPEDRLAAGDHAQGDPEGAAKKLFYRVPPAAELEPDGLWGRWIDFLYRRYAHHGDGVVLEVMNEPNLQWWPQRDAAPGGDPFELGELAAPRAAARMMATAQAIGERNGNQLLLGGPAVWDGPKRGASQSRLWTGYEEFTARLLDELDEVGFRAGERFVWTQHNYMDTLFGHGRPGSPSNRAARTRSLLVDRWSGLGGPKTPEVWLTEGGADLRERVVGADRELQARLVGENWNRMADAGGDGAGIGMVTNYLGYSEFHYDTGMREPLEAGGVSRPLERTWRELPARG